MTPVRIDLLGERVRFRIKDVHLPDASGVLALLHGETLEGHVTDFTDSGDDLVYALVEVDARHKVGAEVSGSRKPVVVVPVESLLPW